MARTLSSSRMEAFSDGVFSIAATLLVLDITLHPPGTPLEQGASSSAKLVAEAIHDTNGERVFVTLYGVTLLTIRLLGFALDAYARREHLYSQEQADEELRSDRRTLVPVVISYGVAILIGLALPILAVVLYFALAVFIVVSFREVRRLLFRRS